ncbi:MAG: HAMP domain-containing histidine kinase [Spirochaetia bacterium]|nr:HAMP domain-containing histidine kinase [Spirochaetia bacterium]
MNKLVKNFSRKNDTKEGRGDLALAGFGFLVAYLALFILLVFFVSALQDREDLMMQNNAEKAFNTAIFSIQDSEVNAMKALKENGILGVGIYSQLGSKIFSEGDVPLFLPLDFINDAKNWEDVKTQGKAQFNSKTKKVEYVRMIDRAAISSYGINLTSLEPTLSSLPSIFSDVLYIALDGTAYHQRIMQMRLLLLLALVFLTLLFLFILHIYISNRKYRQTLERQRSLVNLGQAARTLTHEIKNPLSAIAIQVAILRYQTGGQYTSNLDIIETETKRVTDLTDKVSEFLHNPKGNPKDIPLRAFFSDLIGKFSQQIDFYIGEDCTIWFDPDRARSVFENLMKNALESGPDPQVEVVISQEKKKNMVVIEVKDRGTGLPVGAEDKIFNPFFTTKEKGSGIGLAISSQFVKAQQGTLTLFPREGGGTVARVVLHKGRSLPSFTEE